MKQSNAERSRKWRAANRERARELGRACYARNRERFSAERVAWAKAHPERMRARRIKRLYGLTLDEIQQMELAQNGKCAICKQDFSSTPCVDHDHKTGKPRALLCHHCNLGVGWVEKEGWVETVQKYLEQYGPSR